jgi:iron complex outermembrane receptor protein
MRVFLRLREFSGNLVWVLLLAVIPLIIPQGVFPQDTASREETGDEDEKDYLLMEDETGLTVVGKQNSPVVPEGSPYGRHNEVSAEQIHEQGSQDLLDALRNVPGVSFSKRNSIGGDTGTSLYIRGRGASHPSVETITNFDGVPRNGAIYGQSMPDSFPIDIAESINVYKSPQPSAFGVGYALVDIVPRYMKKEGWEMEGGLSLGSFLTLGENVSFGYKHQAFDIFAAQSWTSTAGHTEHSAAYQQSYYFNSGWTFNANWNLRLLGNFVNARSERPRREGQSAEDILPSFLTNSALTTVTANNNYDKALGYVKAYYSHTDFHWEDESSTVPGEYSIQDITAAGVRLKENLWLWENGEIIAGSDFDWTIVSNLDHNEISSSVYSDFPDMFLFSPYLAASHTFGRSDWFHATPQAGVRGYMHMVWANAAAPQIGAVAGYKNTNIYVNYVLGYVYPAPANIQTLVNMNGVQDADLKSIKPEMVYHYEAGITHQFPGTAALGTSFFYDDGRNRIIANDIVPKNASVVSYFRIMGVEVYGTLTLLEDLSLFAGGTWMKVEAQGEDGVTVDKMPFTPDKSFSAGFMWKLSCFKIPYLENVTLSGDYRYLGGVYANTTLQFNAGFINYEETSKLDDQHIVRLRLAYELNYKQWHIDRGEAFINIDNLLNQCYEYWSGYRMPGITVTGGVSIKMR